MVTHHGRNSIIIKDRTKSLLQSLRNLTKEQVLVGIPEDKGARQDDAITNAALGYIHEFGAPAANIPARPFLVPGVQKAKIAVIPHLRKAAEFAMAGDSGKAHLALMRAGLVAQNFVKREINNGNFIPLKPNTVANRHIARGTKSMRPSEARYMDLIEKGASPANAQAATGIKPLINTGQLRNSITFVVRRGWRVR